MALPKPPPPLEVSLESRRLVLAGFKKIVEIFQEKGLLEPAAGHTDILHDPGLLLAFEAAFNAHPSLYAHIVVDAKGLPVTQPDRPLTCGLTIAQVQQLAVRTCARFLFLGEEEERLVTRTVTTTKYLIFKETQRITERVRGKDPRLLKEILVFIAFDWQLPLLAEYVDLTLPQLAELGGNILALRTPESVREIQKFGPEAIRKVKALLGPDFTAMLEARPGAMRGLLHWPKDMHQFFRALMPSKFYDFMARDEKYFMYVGQMNKPMMTIYGDVLGYIAMENLIELHRLNLDRTEVLLATMKATFGPRMEALLTLPNFSREILRRQVEGLTHVNVDKKQMTDIHSITWGAAAPQVLAWLAKQQKAA
jgi:hypothetical protein